jgi:YidC/Oxa1 family membrane protein insertase
MINSLVLLYYVFFSNFGLAIIVFTVLVRSAMIPLTVKQSKSMKAMTSLQPKMKEIQEKFKGDRQMINTETMKLYKEQGVNPIGCLGPMVIQMPIFFGLFWALRGTLPSTPERLADLSKHLYSWLPQVHQSVPLEGQFLWMDLAKYSSQNPVPFLLPVLVGVSMWLMQKISATPSMSAQQESTNRMMLWLMPIMFGFFTLNFESGLALYWIVSNMVGVVIQGFITGWAPLATLLDFGKRPVVPEPAGDGAGPAPAVAPLVEEASDDESDRDKRKKPRGGGRNRPKGVRRRAQGRRSRNP